MANKFQLGDIVHLNSEINHKMVVLESVKVLDDKFDSSTGFKLNSTYKYRCGWFIKNGKEEIIFRDNEWFYMI